MVWGVARDLRVIAIEFGGKVTLEAIEFGPDALRQDGTMPRPDIAQLPAATTLIGSVPVLASLHATRSVFAVNPKRSYWTNDRFGGFFFVVSPNRFRDGEVRLWLVTNRPTTTGRELSSLIAGFDWRRAQAFAIYVGPPNEVFWEPLGHDSRRKDWVKLGQ